MFQDTKAVILNAAEKNDAFDVTHRYGYKRRRSHTE